MNIGDVRSLLLRATNLGMTQPEYLYIVPDIEGFEHTGLDVWRRNDSNDDMAREAFRRVMLVLIKTPSHDSFQQMLHRLNELMFGNKTSSYVTATYNDEEIEGSDTTETSAQQYILNGYYNCFLVYLTAVNDTLTHGGDIRDGQTFIKKIFNRTYLVGDEGEFKITAEGNRVVDMAVADMVDEVLGQFQEIGQYEVLTRNFTLNVNYQKGWPSGNTYVLSVPLCGYSGELCHNEPLSLQLAMGVSFVIILLIIAMVTAFIMRLRYLQRIKNLNWWSIQAEELQAVKIPTSRSVFNTSSNQRFTNASTMSEVSLTGRDHSMYKGTLVHMHLLASNNIRVNASLLKEFQMIRDMNHPNLLRILGACLEGERKMIIVEYCPKGTLQELLMDQSFKLDILFCLCILSDIVRALIYIHKHPLRVHGRLTSEVCMIDSRFSVKVGYYGLPTIYDSVKLLSKTQRKENDNLWIAPELLSCTGRATQKGDVYSLAIIISEILTREEPYSNDKDHMSSQEVLNKIQENFEPPFRPTVSAPKEMAIIEHLMRECWSSDPEKRPSLNRVHNIIHGLMMKNNQTGSLVDNLLQRLEKYSSNLERIVDEKVTELKQEKQKSEELLRQMLPASVADRLKAGLLVEPEFYDCVTIYFSDIVGFTDICSMLEPVHIVKMLNDLYSCFDGIIEHFDVYKVETIGDAYMVVSGLPARNGNEHARQIARMSIALLDAVSNFAPLDTPNKDQLKLRIGLNSGPVCAGVVGLKMPRYCLFGDAVNTASRMESNGAEMKIHVSNSTASILQEFGHFVLQSRGTVEIKGKGTMETFWLLSEKDLSSPVTLE
ncbi:atrial natriuretic peptide receptor 1-like isoform X3 [Biomphalaria glabrata]|nr:atrial natriuretic peptide receptor 1-like isoform X3 [Biomphalaria glabrata]